MKTRLFLALLMGAALAPFSASAQIFNTFGAGVIRAGTTTGQSTTTSRETTNTVQQTYGGSIYSSTGQNITSDGKVGLGQEYSIAEPSAPFQFSESFQPAGITSVTTTGRTLDTTTVTNTLSVFSEIGGN